MPYKYRIITIPGHFRIVKIETSSGEKEVRKWCEPHKRKIRVWVPPKGCGYSQWLEEADGNIFCGKTNIGDEIWLCDKCANSEEEGK